MLPIPAAYCQAFSFSSGAIFAFQCDSVKCAWSSIIVPFSTLHTGSIFGLSVLLSYYTLYDSIISAVALTDMVYPRYINKCVQYSCTYPLWLRACCRSQPKREYRRSQAQSKPMLRRQNSMKETVPVLRVSRNIAKPFLTSELFLVTKIYTVTVLPLLIRRT